MTGSVATITFYAGDDVFRKCIDVMLIDDDITEDTEAFTVTMTPTDSSDTVAIGTATVTITDNDGRSGMAII